MKHYKKIIIEAGCPAIGAMLLIGLLKPFGLDQYEHGIWLPCLGVGIFTFVITFVSLNLCAHFARESHPPRSIRQYLRHATIQHAVTLCLLAFPLVSFASWVWHRDWTYWWFDERGHFTFSNYFECLGQVTVVGVFILIWDIYQFRNRQLKSELEDVRIINQLLERRQREMEEKDDASPQMLTKGIAVLDPVITLASQRTKSTLTFNPKELIYAESVANYANFYYLSDGKIQSATLRLTLRSLCAELQDYEMLTQCHRAVLVNLNYVESLHSTSTSAYVLRLFGVDKAIPVSRTFLSTVKAKLHPARECDL